MSLLATSYKNDMHLYPLYMSWAQKNFQKGNAVDGMEFFNAARGIPRLIENKIYKQMWKIRGCPQGDPKYGEKCFHCRGSLSSTKLEKANAIQMALRKVDRTELQLRENKVHECLWEYHHRPVGDLEYGRHAFYNEFGKRSTIQDKLVAATMYANKSRVMTWLSDRGEVHLLKRADGRLERLAIDDVSGDIGTDIINTGGFSNEQVISMLLQCNATVNQGAVGFPKFPVCSTWPAQVFLPEENKELGLHLKDNNLVWRLFDKNTRTASWAYAYEDVKDAMLHMEFVRRQEGKICLQDFNINVQVTRINRILLAKINLLKFSSRMDPNVKIDSKNWAITLFTAGESHSDVSAPYQSISTWMGHAMLAFEGVEDGRPFLRYAHLTHNKKIAPFPTVQIIDAKDCGELPIRNKSQTWIRKRHWAKNMIKEIEKEEGKEVPFEVTNDSLSFAGLKNNFSWFMYGERPFYRDNCLVWSIKKVWLTGIEPPPWNALPIPMEYISTIASNPELVKFNPTCDL